MSENGNNTSPELNNENGLSYSSLREADPDLCDLLTRKQPKFMPKAPKCAKCEKNVYKAEELRAANKTFHKLCFKCTLCNKLLETNILTEHQGDLFCRNCYAKSFGPKGYGYGTGAGTLSTENGAAYTSLNPIYTNSEEAADQSKQVQITSTLRSTFSTLNYNNMSNTNGNTNAAGPISPPPNNGNYQMSALNYEKRTSVYNMTFGGSDKCARCNKPVYAAEKIVAAGKPFHKLCFSCYTCKKLLSSMNCCDNSDSQIFCKGCYGKQYGPKGVGYGIGAGTLNTT